MAIANTYYYIQARAGIGGWVQAIQTASQQIQSGSGTASWVPGSMPNGGSIHFDYTNLTSPSGTSTIDVYIRELYTGQSSQIFYAASDGAAFQGFQTAKTDPLGATLVELATYALDGIVAMLESVAGATTHPRTGSSAVFSGRTLQAMGLSTALVMNGVDVQPFVIVVTDSNELQYLGADSQLLPPVPQISQGFMILNGQQLVANQLPMDIEMAINSGGSIFSISSGTFTEP